MGDIHLKHSTKLVSPKEMLALARKSRAGDLDAREQLILLHLPFVAKIARQYTGRGVDYDDLYQEACYGLLLAVDRFDPDYGTLLSTYAVNWIHKRLKKAVREQGDNSSIVLPEAIYYFIRRYHRAISTLETQLGRLPSDEEIATYMKTDLSGIKSLRNHIYSFISLDGSRFCDAPDSTHAQGFHLALPPEKLSPSAEDEVLSALHEPDFPVDAPRLTKREMIALCRHLGFTSSGQPEPFRIIAADTGWSLETLRMDYHRAIYKLRLHLVGV